jgi:hypothetical protein
MGSLPVSCGKVHKEMTKIELLIVPANLDVGIVLERIVCGCL